MADVSAFEPRTAGATPPFLDTGGLYPYFYDGAAQHEAVTAFFAALAGNELPSRPLLTNQDVADELVSPLLGHAGYRTARTGLETLRDSTALTVRSVTDEIFDRATEEFLAHDAQAISVTDHAVGVQTDENGCRHVLANDDDFEVLGLTVVPGG